MSGRASRGRGRGSRVNSQSARGPVVTDTMASLKLDGFLKPYSGKGDDFTEFWEKFLVLAELSGWDTDDKKLKRLPLFLVDDAFLVHSKMPSADKADKDKVVALLQKSFSVSPSEAYKQFTCRKFRSDETPESYVADLRRLLALAGHQDKGNADPVVIEQFVAGLPVDFAKELRLSSAGQALNVSRLCGQTTCTVCSQIVILDLVKYYFWCSCSYSW